MKHRGENNKRDSEIEELKRQVTELQSRLDEFEGENLDKSGPSQATHKLFFIDKILPDFQESLFRVGADKKKGENKKQELGYIKSFIQFMWGSSSDTAPAHLKFLNEPSKLNDWVKVLTEKFKVTTCKNYLISVCKFFEFLIERRPSSVRLGQKILEGLLRHLKMQKHSLAKKIVGHRQHVKELKTRKMPTRNDLRELITTLRGRIPEFLDELSEDPSCINTRNEAIGALATYIFICTGHRVSVLVNLTLTEFNECQEIDNLYVINVSSHKTSGSFGRAKIALNNREYLWMQQFVQMRRRLSGYHHNPGTFFFSSSGEPLKKLCELVRKTCLDCGMCRGFSVTEIRSAVATCAQRNLPDDQRRLVAQIMCHSLTTADKFYVAELEVNDLQRGRAFVNEALGIGKSKALKTSTPYKRLRPQVLSSDDDDQEGAVGVSPVLLPSHILEEDPACEPQQETDSIVYIPVDFGEEVVEVTQEEGEGEEDLEEMENDEEEGGENEEDLEEMEKDDEEGGENEEEDLEEMEKDEEGGENEEEENIDFNFVLDDDEEEEDSPKVLSPLPKYVEDIDGRRLRCRRRLVYPESLKAMVREKFSSYWNQKITTQIINSTLMKNTQLLLSCKVLRLTIDNFRSLVQLLQRQDAMTMSDDD
nr:uncharacterized protein LOC111842576 [Paramormyrops kingsleyae]